MADGVLKDAVAERIPMHSLEMDEADHKLVSLLRQDGRMAFKALAEKTGLTENTVRSRLRRLEEQDLLRVVAVTDFEAAGFSLMLAVGVQVEGRSAAEVATDLAAFPEVFSVCQVVGSHDIECLMVAEDQEAISQLLTKRLASVPGVRRLLPAMAIDVLKNQPNWVLFDKARGAVDERSAASKTGAA